MIDISGNTVVIDVIDFGLSKYLAGKTEIRAANWGQPDGSPKYMAPEVGAYTIEKGEYKFKNDNSTYSKASDIYSLGIMFRDDFNLHKTNTAMSDLITNMLDRNPYKRPTMEVIVRILSNPDNYKDYENLYNKIYEKERTYKLESTEGNEAKFKSTAFLWKNFVITSDTQLEMVNKVKKNN